MLSYLQYNQISPKDTAIITHCVVHGTWYVVRGIYVVSVCMYLIRLTTQCVARDHMITCFLAMSENNPASVIIIIILIIHIL